MKETEIIEKVQIEVKKWTTLQKKRNFDVALSPKAVDFLCLMIENIQEDKSQFWDYNQLANQDTQKIAISLIPRALDDLTQFYYFDRRFFLDQEVKISSWEIWHSLSRIIDRFCFIRKDI